MRHEGDGCLCQTRRKYDFIEQTEDLPHLRGREIVLRVHSPDELNHFRLEAWATRGLLGTFWGTGGEAKHLLWGVAQATRG